jgi:hypothetical protein
MAFKGVKVSPVRSFACVSIFALLVVGCRTRLGDGVGASNMPATGGDMVISQDANGAASDMVISQDANGAAGDMTIGDECSFKGFGPILDPSECKDGAKIWCSFGYCIVYE